MRSARRNAQAINWSNYPLALKRFIDQDAAAGNVEMMRDYQATWSQAMNRGDKRALLRYIKAKTQEAKRARIAWDRELRR